MVNKANLHSPYSVSIETCKSLANNNLFDAYVRRSNTTIDEGGWLNIFDEVDWSNGLTNRDGIEVWMLVERFMNCSQSTMMEEQTHRSANGAARSGAGVKAAVARLYNRRVRRGTESANFS